MKLTVLKSAGVAIVASLALAIGSSTAAIAVPPATDSGTIRATSTPVEARLETPSRDAREPAGKYFTTCVTATGHSFDWTDNNPRTCNGWLQIRINGQQVGNINMSVIPSSTPTVLCVLGAGHATISLYFVSTPAGWVLALSALLLARLGCA